VGDTAGASVSSEQASSRHDIERALIRLSQISFGKLELADTVTELSRIVVELLAEEHVVVRSAEPDRADVWAASSDLAAQLEELQEALDQGPTQSATPAVLVSGPLAQDARWPAFGGRAARLGMQAAMSIAFGSPELLTGSVTVYSDRHDAFSSTRQQLLHTFVGCASVLLRNAQELAEAQRLVDQLRAQLDQFAAVERAVGMLMTRRGWDAEIALTALRKRSQRENEKLTTVAQRLLDEAVRVARAAQAKAASAESARHTC
jgi:GAF domain-containing protein